MGSAGGGLRVLGGVLGVTTLAILVVWLVNVDSLVKTRFEEVPAI